MDYAKFGDTADHFSLDGHNWTFTIGVDGQVHPLPAGGCGPLPQQLPESDYDYIDSAHDR